MAEETFNPDGYVGDPIMSTGDAIEGAACVGLARWLTSKPAGDLGRRVVGQEANLAAVNVLCADSAPPTFYGLSEGDDALLWERAVESWMLLHSIGRATRRIVAADEVRHWWRGDI